MKLILQYLKPMRLRMLIGLSIKMTGTLFELVLPTILAFIIDDLVPMGQMGPILQWGGIMVLCALFAWLFNITANRFAAWVAGKSMQRVRYDLFVKALNLSQNQINQVTIPSLETRLTADTYNVHQFIGMAQRLGVRAPMLFTGGVLFCLFLEWRLAVVLLFLIPLISAVMFFISKKVFPKFRALQGKADDMTRIIRETIKGIRVIKSLDKMEDGKKGFSDVSEDYAASEFIARRQMAVSNPLINIILYSGLAQVILLGGYLVSQGEIQPGVIIAFMTYFILITNSILQLNRMLMMYNRAAASADRMYEIMALSTPTEKKVYEAGKKASDWHDDAHIEFDDVVFTYHGNTKPTIDHLSFSLAHGETLGIIGETGSGKSTILSLLLRFYDPTRGEIRFSGVPLQHIPFEELHSRFGIVYQSDFLYASTIRENIDMGRGLSDAEILEACRNAQAMQIIEEKEGGLDHRLTSKGNNLSGGQKQRILLARALAGKPEVLVLDDSASALDFRTEAALRKAIHENFQHTTTIQIAQRISSVMQTDKILVLDQGKMVGFGSHEELLKDNEAYQKIYDQQIGGRDVTE